MTMKRALGVMMLVLLACGPGADTPTVSPAGPDQQGSKTAEEKLEALRDSFVWGDASQPAHDWDADVEACEARVGEDPSVREGAHRLAKIAAVMKCMDEMGWEQKRKNR